MGPKQVAGNMMMTMTRSFPKCPENGNEKTTMRSFIIFRQK